MASPYDGSVHAPDFPEGLDWINVDQPLTMEGLRGKVVILDFWTYCCINCIHILSDLKKLERDFPEELVVVGVHSPKFEGEKVSENVRQAVMRYEIEHAVVNDHTMRMWQEYGVRAWPTLSIINPKGRVIGNLSGEGHYVTLKRAIVDIIKHFDDQQLVQRTPLVLKIEKKDKTRQTLNFPGKVLAVESTNQLFISDSNHNRIVVVNLNDGKVQSIIGSGKEGRCDGDFVSAEFNHPQGMACDGKNLYVADTENHTIRLVDLEEKKVTTIAGTGYQARVFNVEGEGLKTGLNSPWDLEIHEGVLFVAMAGCHQIWQMDLESHFIKPFAGSSHENLVDGPLMAAALAQPSGLTKNDKKLYFADSEISAIRSAEFRKMGRVQTLVGSGLFDFGDVDGPGGKALLQHPLGVVYGGEGQLYLTDTYNNKIKHIDLKMEKVTTLAGSGDEGKSDGDCLEATFDEPAGLSISNQRLYVADTNNHLVRVIDLESKQVSTLDITW